MAINKTRSRRSFRKRLTTVRTRSRRAFLNPPTIKKGDKKAHIVRIFLEMLNMVKLYHWRTRSYAQHKATDELYAKLNEQIDQFVETLMGKDESRIKMVEKRIDLIDSSSTKEFKERVHEYREFLIGLNDIFDEKRDSDLFSLRDDLLVTVNQFLYLLTLNK